MVHNILCTHHRDQQYEFFAGEQSDAVAIAGSDMAISILRRFMEPAGVRRPLSHALGWVIPGPTCFTIFASAASARETVVERCADVAWINTREKRSRLQSQLRAGSRK
jgi:hypothetical protein